VSFITFLLIKHLFIFVVIRRIASYFLKSEKQARAVFSKGADIQTQAETVSHDSDAPAFQRVRIRECMQVAKDAMQKAPMDLQARLSTISDPGINSQGTYIFYPYTIQRNHRSVCGRYDR
jgi:hypothetical protein